MGILEVQRVLRTSRSVYNVGSAEYPIWTWKIGNRTTRDVLSQTIMRLLAERPMSLEHLVNATGATAKRVTVAVRAIQKHERLAYFGDMLFLLSAR